MSDLKIRETSLTIRKGQIKGHLEMLVQKATILSQELKEFRKSLDGEELDVLVTLENATEYIENTDWHLTRGLSLSRDYLAAKRLLEEEQNKLSKGEI